MVESVRVDRWLWAARLFKTRQDAAAACDAGHVRLGERALKPGARIQAGHELEVRNLAGRWRVRVVRPGERRVGPPQVGSLREDLEVPPPPPPRAERGFDPAAEAGSSRPTRQQRDALQAFRSAAASGQPSGADSG